MLVSCDAAASINGINKDARLRASHGILLYELVSHLQWRGGSAQ